MKKTRLEKTRKYVHNLFVVLALIFSSQISNAQCCGNGVCDPGEDSLTCPIDCDTSQVGFNCLNTLGSFSDLAMDPSFSEPSEATARGIGACYTLTPPYPANVCFEYKVPVGGIFLNMVINGYSGGAPNSIFFPRQPVAQGQCGAIVASGLSIGIEKLSTFADDCSVFDDSTLVVGSGAPAPCNGQISPGDILTICLDLGVLSFDSLVICPLTDCGTETCATTQTTITPPCPPITFTKDSTAVTCVGNLVDGTATVTPDCGAHFTYLWNDSLTQTDSNAIGLSAGIYNVVVTNTVFPQCVDTVTVVVDDVVNPIASFTATPNSGKAPLEITFTNTSTGTGLTYLWDFGDSTATSDSINPIHIYTTSGTYTTTLIVTDSIGCTATFSIDVIVDIDFTVLIPNVFTPNGDNMNDFFTAVLTDYNTFQMEIYNRWGQLIFETNELSPGWNGENSGSESPAGVYYYLIKVVDKADEENEYKGFLHLMRSTKK